MTMTDKNQNQITTVGDIDLGSMNDYGYISVGAGPGQFTINSSNGLSWGDITNNTTLDSVNIKETATFEGDVIIKGKNLANTLEEINKRLNILTVDPELEGRWDELKRLGDQYRALEANILSKERLVDNLMKDYNID